MRKLTTEEWIVKAKSVYGDKYDYSESVYTGTEDQIKIICPIHGEFWTKARQHIEGTGCRDCLHDPSKRFTMEEMKQKWHPVKNGNLDIEALTHNDKKNIKLWWKCPIADDHEWQSKWYHIFHKHSDCPCCSGHKVVNSNCMATTHPWMLDMWHPTKNEGITPFDLVAGSMTKVWWSCSIADDHEWISTCAHIKNSRGCPCCHGLKVVPSNSFATTHPHLINQWHPKNILNPTDVVGGSERKVWWICSKGHEWESTVANRTTGHNCPYCSNNLVCKDNSLATLFPEIAKQWHPTKNGSLTPDDLTYGSNKIVWWKCDVADDHEWEASCKNRTSQNYGCLCCASFKIVLSNCLATTHPELCKEWHPTKNVGITPFDLHSGSTKKIWWICPKKGHEYHSMVINRTTDHGCPRCNESKGEKYIANFLKDHNIEYKPQIKFDNCKHKSYLPFDFGITINNQLHLIEFQGIQHFEPVSFGKKKNADLKLQLETIQFRDLIKYNYCIENNILLLRIHYLNFNKIDQLLVEFLKL